VDDSLVLVGDPLVRARPRDAGDRVGFVILGVAWLWYVYRHVRGLIALLNGEPMPR